MIYGTRPRVSRSGGREPRGRLGSSRTGGHFDHAHAPPSNGSGPSRRCKKSSMPPGAQRHGNTKGRNRLEPMPDRNFRAYSSTAEQGTHNPLVPGSNPGGPNESKGRTLKGLRPFFVT